MRSISVGVAISLGLAATAAHAFTTGEQFDGDPVTTDGAGGIAFDGAPRWTSHTCAVCHTDPPGIIGLGIEADHQELFSTGWAANQQYHLRVVMTREHEGVQYASLGDVCGSQLMPYKPCDDNGFALELDDDSGNPTGKFVPVVSGACAAAGAMIPPDVDAYILKDGTAAVHNGAHHAQIQWDVCWTAPAAGAGTITAYVAAVDGNGGDGTANFPNDTLGDDVAFGAVPLAEAGAAPPPAENGGCNATGDASLATGALVLAAFALLRRRRRSQLALLLAIASLAGCVHVRPRQRATLAERKMVFAPDPQEDELDLHMQEAREGSSGGYGSSGGGCGCN